MSLTVTQNESIKIEPLKAGVYIGTCIGVIDIGTQRNVMFDKYQKRIIFIFEIAGETVEVVNLDGLIEEKPRWLSKEMTASLDQRAAMWAMLCAWFNRDKKQECKTFDVGKCLGQSCQVQVSLTEKDGKRFNRVENVMALPNGVSTPTPASELLLYDLDAPDADVFKKLPAWIQQRINASQERQDAAAEDAGELDFDDADGAPAAIPF